MDKKISVKLQLSVKKSVKFYSLVVLCEFTKIVICYQSQLDYWIFYFMIESGIVNSCKNLYKYFFGAKIFAFKNCSHRFFAKMDFNENFKSTEKNKI